MKINLRFKLQESSLSFIRAYKESTFSIMMSHKNHTDTYLISATDIGDKQLKELSVVVIINNEIFICLAIGVCPISFGGSQILHKYYKICLFPP